MILGAGLLVLAGLGLFVAALLTGINALYWACVAVCAVAALLLVVARRGLTARATPSRSAAQGAADGDDVVAPASQRATATVGAGARDATDATATDSSATEPADDRAGAIAQAEPEVEEVEVTDLLLVLDLRDEVLVVDEHPRYHVAGCAWLGERETIPIPLDEARTDGFTPCAVCRPDRTLADRARSRR